MKHTVLVPAWRRADMLHACLTRLSMAANEDVTVVVSLDRRGTTECRQVTESFSRQFPNIYLRIMHFHTFHGNSHNVLSGVKDCMKLGGDLIHIVEDDIMVSLGYFAYHEAMHSEVPDAFSVSACRNQNFPDGEPEAAYRHASYQSLGVSFRPDVAERVIAHAKPLYYGDMVSYCQANFPNSAIQPGHSEQDGLFNRIRESIGGTTVYTSRPRAFHAGFYGYNRPGTKIASGTIQQRSERILSMTTEEMNAMAGEMKDHEVIDLNENLPVDMELAALKG